MKYAEGAAVIIAATASILVLLGCVGWVALNAWEYVHDKLREERMEVKDSERQ